MNNILFLDFDGVLNSLSFMEKEGLKHLRGILDPAAVERLNRIVEETKCKIVISSSWRLFVDHNNEELLGKVLESFGFKYKNAIIDITKELRVCPPYYNTKMSARSYPASRGLEIQDWLNWNKCDNFVILEDAEHMGHLEEYTIRTTWEEGLTDERAEAAIFKLKDPTDWK